MNRELPALRADFAPGEVIIISIQHQDGIELRDQPEPEKVYIPEPREMEALSRVAGTIAHDVNNFLTIISGYGQMLKDGLSRNQPEEKLQVYVDEILSAGNRAARLTDKLLAFSGHKSVRMHRLDISLLADDLKRTLQNIVGDEIDLTIEQTGEPCCVWADAGQISEILINLTTNAAEAMPRGGRISIRITNAGETVSVEVEDTGHGIAADGLARIFEPFSTSKPKGLAVGLGLSVVFGLVRQTGGMIAVRSEPDIGTMFRISFPLCTEADALKKAGKARTPRQTTFAENYSVGALGGNETILLVEDDQTVRTLVAAMLSRHGYKMLIADGGKAATEIFEKSGSAIGLLLTDVMMPEMNGRELAVSLRQKLPRLRVLYMSGYTAEELAEHVDCKPLLIQKPFSAEALARRVREALDQPQPS